MITAIVGSGGKTTLLKQLAQEARQKGKTVFVTTTTHMFIEEDALLTDDADLILSKLERDGYVMAGNAVGSKLCALSLETFQKVAAQADITLVEADGSRHLPIKFPNSTEPVIPPHTDEIIVVCGMHALGKPAAEVCHRFELAQKCLSISNDTLITPEHIWQLVREGYIKPLQASYPKAKITVYPAHDASPLQAEGAHRITEAYHQFILNNQDL